MVKMDSNLNDYLNSTSELNQHHPTTINNINTSSLHLNQTQQNSLDHLTQELVNQDIRFSQLITQLSTYLTSQLIFTRIKTIHLIYQTIDRLLQLKPNYFKSSELNPIIDFLTDKLSDDPQILTEALQALQSLSQFTSFGLDQITRTCKASVNPSSSKWWPLSLIRVMDSTHQILWKYFQPWLQSTHSTSDLDFHWSSLGSSSSSSVNVSIIHLSISLFHLSLTIIRLIPLFCTSCSSDLQQISNSFITSYCQHVQGEKDPRNLLVAFRLAKVILTDFDVSQTIEVSPIATLWTSLPLSIIHLTIATLVFLEGSLRHHVLLLPDHLSSTTW